MRDLVLEAGAPGRDTDYVVVGATPDDMLEQGFIRVGKAFPVFIHPETKAEYALARTETKIGEKHTDFSFCTTPDISMEQDALRRDFTVNALYVETDRLGDCDAILDPTGYGLADCSKRILRHVGPSFREDPLRVLRAARFSAQLGFTVADETLAEMRSMTAEGMLAHLSRERVDNEFLTAMAPGYDSRRFLEVMHACGALQALYPEIADLHGCIEPLKYHATGTTWNHVLSALDVARDESPEVKTALVYHDIYKPIAYRRRTQAGAYVLHDDQTAHAYLRQVLASKRFPASTKALCETALRYHMRVWKVLMGMSIAKWVDTIDAITHGFRAEYAGVLDAVLAICRADALSDRGEAVDVTIFSEEGFATLAECAHDTLRICQGIHARVIEGYADLETDRLVERVRQKRVDAVRVSVPFFASCGPEERHTRESNG